MRLPPHSMLQGCYFLKFFFFFNQNLPSLIEQTSLGIHLGRCVQSLALGPDAAHGASHDLKVR